uniref:Uncharacterized protein n=1 Tax=Parastrongyloides trichosuri TaxID=131310 RepID=A0A0N4ZGH2_PARTI
MSNVTSNKRLHRVFVYLSVIFTCLGCFFATISMFSTRWQIVDLVDMNSIHEHGILYDCTSTTNIPLSAPLGVLYYHSCSSKFDHEILKSINDAIQEINENGQKEVLMHRFLPHHRAILFFTIFANIFGGISAITGLCSPCFVPNALLHVVSSTISASCLVMADISFIVHAISPQGSKITELGIEYTQYLGYACYFHVFSTFLVGMGCLLAVVGAYIRYLLEWQDGKCCCFIFDDGTSKLIMNGNKYNNPNYRLSYHQISSTTSSDVHSLKRKSSTGLKLPTNSPNILPDSPNDDSISLNEYECETNPSNGYNNGTNVISVGYRPNPTSKIISYEDEESKI